MAMPMAVYAFSNRADVVKNASSGGAFLAVADAFFRMEPERAHAVYGVCFNTELMPVYERVTTLADCGRFCGSKYVRADLNGAYRSVREDLKSGGAVLFVGTPCQVSGLKKHLTQTDTPFDGLYCVDLICHGTPQPAYWADYKAWLEKKYKDTLVDYAFRTHGAGKSPYAARAVFEKKTVVGDLEISLYNRLFLRHYLFASGCFDCPFANLDRVGDITLGDFWGIEEVMPDFPCKHVSEMLINSDKGVALMASIRENAAAQGYTVAECHSDGYVKYQNNLQKPADKPADYNQFHALYQRRGMDGALKRYAHYDWKHRLKYHLTGKK
jgi:coenzyme F420-reducing hydrogenase beta subunit